jgi:hypothetical protein
MAAPLTGTGRPGGYCMIAAARVSMCSNENLRARGE